VEEKKSLKEGTKGEISEEAKDAIEKAGEEIAKELTEILDITEEDLLDMMEILGLTFVDLFNPESLQQLVTQIGGQEQALNLITDSDIYTSLQDLIEGAESMKDELMNEFDLSEEDFTNLMTQDKEISFKEAGKEIFAEIPEDHLTRKVDLIRQDFKMPHQEAPQSEDVQPIDEPVIGRPVEIDTQSEQGQHKNGNHFQNGEQSANLFNQIVDNIAEAAVPEAVDTISYTDRAQMENIIRQITDKITISASAETKSIELSLHPASLGNVNILLSSSKDGIVAKFTAQNEIVKEAVESQMMQLQQKFEEQGIKVTSIEVTIASHAFEQNLQNQDRSGQEEQPGAQKKNLRRINLFEMTQEEEDDMTEAERIAAQMMAMNGNTVDFSA
jgi:flagellar hook-length control protein FliK